MRNPLGEGRPVNTAVQVGQNSSASTPSGEHSLSRRFLTQALAFVISGGFVCHHPTVLHCESTRAGNTDPTSLRDRTVLSLREATGLSQDSGRHPEWSSRPLASSAADSPNVVREPKAFVVQAAKLLQFPARQSRPSTKQGGKTVITDRPLHEEFVVVQCGEVGRQSLHRLDRIIPLEPET